MGETEYQEALKLGKKEYKSCVYRGRFPYLPVLDDILSKEDIRTEQNMGLIQIPGMAVLLLHLQVEPVRRKIHIRFPVGQNWHILQVR